jgi:pyruvate/2-oxoglutarate dehydrogenase complex dihydrolipoamide dehydrogenase (E3) component
VSLPPLTQSEYDRLLLDRLRPADWENPGSTGRYHMLVIGGGTAGLVTAALAAGLGASTALVERGLMGGDCLNVGCVPSKAMLAAARAWRAARRSGESFAGPRTDGNGDFPAVMERMRSLRAEISVVDSPARFRDLGVDVWLGNGVFTSRDAVRVDGRDIRFRRAVIATGSRPGVPGIPGLPDSGYLTNESIFSLTELPRRMIIIGGGSIGCELAQAFGRFGSTVTLLEAASSILPGEDPDAAAIVAAALTSEGVRVAPRAEVRSVAGIAGGPRRVEFFLDGTLETLECDELLVACGRLPNVSDMGLEAAGVEFDVQAGVLVDGRLRTSNRRIFAAGDVVGPHQFTHVADAHARLVVRNALFGGRGKFGDLVVPWCTFTSPELAHVGASYREVRGRGAELDSVTVLFRDVDRARLDGETAGFLRVHFVRGSDRIVAATIVGPNAGELVSHLSSAMSAGVGLGALSEAIYPYPTYGEIIRKAADAWRRTKLTPMAKRVFGRYFSLWRK